MINIKSIEQCISKLQMEANNLKSVLAGQNHPDMGVRMYLNNINKLSNQPLDMLAQMSKQLNFLRNQIAAYELNEKFKHEKEQKKKEREERMLRRARYDVFS